ncbi:MAG: site-specific DNA-methyltransferase, partial [Desulfovibrio sp.]|nr:site-specific DNA-methyltransferase [Desulfovibrio sp.]
MPKQKKVETILHTEATRTNIPPAEFQMAVSEEVKRPVQVSWERRNPDLDPQLVWRGKFDGDETLDVQAPALFTQERISPKDLVQALIREKEKAAAAQGKQAGSLFNLFDGGFKPGADRMDFYRHEHNWSNRFILGDSLQVMASLSERENLRGKVQCVYFDPPYGIKFGSNFQWCTTSTDVKEGKLESMTREPEQIRAFRDTWKDGIHSYLSYIRDRLIVARDLLTDSGSLFLQIGEENVHRVRSVLDEVFGEDSFVAQISFATTSSFSNSSYLPTVFNYILWYAKNREQLKYRQLYVEKTESTGSAMYKKAGEIGKLKNLCLSPDEFVQPDNLTASGKRNMQGAPAGVVLPFALQGKQYYPPAGMHWKTTLEGLARLDKAQRLVPSGSSPRYLRKLADFPAMPLTNCWTDVSTGGFNADKIYVVQTNDKVISRCILMSTDPGDLVLDPTCGSGTTAYAAEQWGRRWIAVDTSRVAIALAKARLMGASFPYYLLADSRDGQLKEAELAGLAPSNAATGNCIAAGFVCGRVPHVMLGDIAKNAEIDVIHGEWQKKLEPLRESLNVALGRSFEEWEVPREADAGWPAEAKKLHAAWWKARTARQEEIDASIARKASFELLYDKPYVDKGKVRVTGPFTVDSVSPYRSLDMDEDGNLVDPASRGEGEDSRNYVDMVLENLQAAGIQQARKEGRLTFSSVSP